MHLGPVSLDQDCPQQMVAWRVLWRTSESDQDDMVGRTEDKFLGGFPEQHKGTPISPILIIFGSRQLSLKSSEKEMSLKKSYFHYWGIRGEN